MVVSAQIYYYYYVTVQTLDTQASMNNHIYLLEPPQYSYTASKNVDSKQMVSFKVDTVCIFLALLRLFSNQLGV